eukprot:gnl/TRDRNA2_/TRDRNA2_42572_c0_seq1.p1 gnl/TRDRNA2_/TRDRNA2_42572_c0~~gnl/TRDRNA2_/TRDRNA2_42572_c0_seq1.p1  ORF type:complete len:339 (+),score=77.01 gnl/TRDRNA2_/TRDRNA2_42572_c0_seq1:110-1126(+)
MILATSDKEQTVVIGDPKANLKSGGDGDHPAAKGAKAPLTQEEIDEYSTIRCSICGNVVDPDDIAQHSRFCVLAPAPNLRLQLDKWCIVSANMTIPEQRALVQMRRVEELARVEELEQRLEKEMTQLWWMCGRFGFIVSSKWLREWRSFVGVGRQLVETKDRPPPPINNNDLFDLDGSMKTGLLEGIQREYRVLEQPIWELYMQVYGGGPTILRYNTSGAMPLLSDQPATFDGDWRDRRPDTGVGKMFDPYSGFGFDGEIRDGFLFTCTGKGLLRNGSHYEGRVVGGMPDGSGREVRPDGTILEGSFRKGKLMGYGRMTDPQGNIMEGEWDNGVLAGI